MEHLRKTEEVTRRCSVKKIFLDILQNSQENIWSQLFFNKVWRRCFPESFAKYLRTHFFTNISIKKFLLALLNVSNSFTKIKINDIFSPCSWQIESIMPVLTIFAASLQLLIGLEMFVTPGLLII